MTPAAPHPPGGSLLRGLLIVAMAGLWAAMGGPAASAEPYQRLETDHFVIEYAKADEGLAGYMAEESEKLRGRIVADIGYDFSDKTAIILAPSIEEFQRRQPGSETVPLWAAATAYPEGNLIILRSPGAVKGGRLDYEKVFVHEFTHIAMGKTMEGRDVPTWLAEGFAMYESSEWHLARMSRLTRAFLINRVIPLERLTVAFPVSPDEAELAYGESFMFVSFLINRFGREAFGQFIRDYAADGDFRGSLRKMTGMHLVALEKEWFDYMEVRVSWIPLITSATTLWFVITVIFVYGYWRKRRVVRAILHAWEEEEGEDDTVSRQAERPLEKDDMQKRPRG